MICLKKSDARASFKPVAKGGGNPGEYGKLTPPCANVKATLEGVGGDHTRASNNFWNMATTTAQRHGVTVQQCGYAANPEPYKTVWVPQRIDYPRQGRQELHIVFHGDNCMRAAADLEKRFLASLPSGNIVY